MSFAILLKDSKPAGVTDSNAVEAASRPPVRLVGSNEPRTSISLPKISAMELRYSCSVRRRRLAIQDFSAGGAAMTAAPPQIAKARASARGTKFGKQDITG